MIADQAKLHKATFAVGEVRACQAMQPEVIFAQLAYRMVQTKSLETSMPTQTPKIPR